MKSLLFQGVFLFSFLPLAIAKSPGPSQKEQKKTSEIKTFIAKGIKELELKNGSGKTKVLGTKSVKSTLSSMLEVESYQVSFLSRTRKLSIK